MSGPIISLSRTAVGAGFRVEDNRVVRPVVPFEAAVMAFRDRVLSLARDGDVDSAVVIAALADVVGISGAMLDARDQTRSLWDRLHSFVGRVEETYERTRSNMGR